MYVGSQAVVLGIGMIATGAGIIPGLTVAASGIPVIYSGYAFAAHGIQYWGPSIPTIPGLRFR